jgi:sodium-dependent phosphate cotransporter
MCLTFYFGVVWSSLLCRDQLVFFFSHSFHLFHIQAEDNPETDNLKSGNATSRKDRPTGSMHVGDVDFEIEDAADIGDASWEEVCRTCCCHTPMEWAQVFGGVVLVLFFLYFFLFGLELLGTGAKVMGGCTAGALFGDETNPIAGLMVGVLATVLLQSSSTTTSIVVALVGADAVSVKQGIYMIMGSNIGTSVTNTIVALGHLGDGDELERAFAGATVHDMFNFMSVAVLLPVEVITGYLFRLTKAMVKNIDTESGDKWEGPVKKLVAPLGSKVIIANKKVVEDIAKGIKECSDFYPINCTDMNNPTYATCKKVGLIGCDKKTGDCPAFFQPEADRHDDVISGFVVFIIALGILFFCLFGLVTILKNMLLGASTRIIYKATNINGYLAMILGAGITMVVQSSSITTSALTPLVGMGVVRLEQMYPLTLGANIGTTVTAILASLVTSGTGSLQVALAHLFFNITGILIWYPIPWMRQWPLHAARQLGKGTRVWRGFPVVYIIVMFFLVPLVFLGLSSLFTEDSKGLTVLGSFVTIILFFVCVWTVHYCKYAGGQEKCYDCMQARQARHLAIGALPEDMEFLKAKIKELTEHTGLPEKDDYVEDDDVEEGAKEAADDDAEKADEPEELSA